jgi:hypothetical protein
LEESRRNHSAALFSSHHHSAPSVDLLLHHPSKQHKQQQHVSFASNNSSQSPIHTTNNSISHTNQFALSSGEGSFLNQSVPLDENTSLQLQPYQEQEPSLSPFYSNSSLSHDAIAARNKLRELSALSLQSIESSKHSPTLLHHNSQHDTSLTFTRTETALKRGREELIRSPASEASQLVWAQSLRTGVEMLQLSNSGNVEEQKDPPLFERIQVPSRTQISTLADEPRSNSALDIPDTQASFYFISPERKSQRIEKEKVEEKKEEYNQYHGHPRQSLLPPSTPAASPTSNKTSVGIESLYHHSPLHRSSDDNTHAVSPHTSVAAALSHTSPVLARTIG